MLILDDFARTNKEISMDLNLKRACEVIDDGARIYNAILNFASVSCGLNDHHVKFIVGFTDMDGDVGSIFGDIDFGEMLAYFISLFTDVMCNGLLDDDQNEIYLEDMERMPVRVAYKENRPFAIGHFLDDKFIIEDDVKAWIEKGGSK